MSRNNVIKPGFFSKSIAADNRRSEFDVKNETIVINSIPVDMVFIGDSITHNWEVNAYFGCGGKLILNRGIGGDTPEYILKRFEADVLQLKPEYAVLSAGINETWVLDQRPSETNTLEFITNKVMNNMASIVDLSQNKQKLVIGSVLPTNIQLPVPGSYSNNIRNELVVKINNRLKTMAEQRGIIYVDYHSQLTASDGKTLIGEVSEDGIHPNVYGYNIMAQVLQKSILLD